MSNADVSGCACGMGSGRGGGGMKEAERTKKAWKGGRRWRCFILSHSDSESVTGKK